MLEIRAVVRAGREHHHRRLALALGRGDRAQAAQELVRVVIDGRDARALEEIGEEPHHHGPVLEHVRHARGRAQVVLEHVELLLVHAHEVDAPDVDVDVARHVDALHLRAVERVTEHVAGGDDARLQDLLTVIDVAQEEVQRAHALLEPHAEHLPLERVHHARDDVERNQPFSTGAVPVDVEGDAEALEHHVGFATLRLQRFSWDVREPAADRLEGGSHCGSSAVHFIEIFGHFLEVTRGRAATAPWTPGLYCLNVSA